MIYVTDDSCHCEILEDFDIYDKDKD